MAISSCRFWPWLSSPAGRSSRSRRPARAATSCATGTLLAQVWAFCHHNQGFWVRACAARRQFSSTVKVGKIVLRW